MFDSAVLRLLPEFLTRIAAAPSPLSAATVAASSRKRPAPDCSSTAQAAAAAASVAWARGDDGAKAGKRMLLGLEELLPREIFGAAFDPAAWPHVLRVAGRPFFTPGEDQVMWSGLLR